MENQKTVRVCVIDLNGPFGPLSSISGLNAPLKQRNIELDYLIPQQRSLAASSRIKGQRVYTFFGKRLSTLDAVRVIGSIEPRPDLLHANSTSAIPIAVLASAVLRIPYVIHLRNSKLSKAEQRMIRIASGWPFKCRVIAVSSLAAEVAGLERGAFRVIPDPVLPGGRRGGERPGDHPRVGAVVNRTPTKGFDVLAEVIAQTDALGLSWHIFGSADDKEANDFVRSGHDMIANSVVKSSVEFHGVVPTLQAKLMDLDVLLLTSRRESFSRVAAEAILAALPLVAPRIAGLSDTTNAGEYAEMYEVANSLSAADALCRVLWDYDSALARAEEGCRYAQDRFSAHKIAAEVEQVYRELFKN